MNLQEIASGWDAFEAAIEAAGGEATEELAAQFDALDLAEREKLDGYALYLKSLRGDAQKYKDLADELYAKQQRAIKRHDWLKERVRFYMMNRGLTEMRGDIYHFKLVESGKPPVEVLVPPNHLPEYLTTVTVAANKEAIRAAILAKQVGSDMARLGEPTVSVRIY